METGRNEECKRELYHRRAAQMAPRQKASPARLVAHCGQQTRTHLHGEGMVCEPISVRIYSLSLSKIQTIEGYLTA